MKALTLLTLTIIVCAFQTAHAQNIGIGTSTPDSSALLELNSTTQGILIPRMSKSQRLLITKPAEALMVYQTNIDTGFYYYSGGQWKSLNSGLTNGNVPSIIIYSKTDSVGKDQIWQANIDGSNQHKLNIVLPAGYTLRVNSDGGQIKITSDSQRIIFKATNSSTHVTSLFSCAINGSNVLKLVDGIGTSIDVN